MSQTRAISPDQSSNSMRFSQSQVSRYFYAGASLLMLVLAFAGFSRFYLHGQAFPGRDIAPPIKALVIAHGIVMTIWLLLVITQSLLIVARKHKLHMLIGKIGAGFAVVVLGLGLLVGTRSAQVTPPEAQIWGLSPVRFMIVPYISVILFASFVGLGVVYNKKPAVHRSMMLLATLSVLGAGISRIDVLNKLYEGTVWDRLFGPFLMTCIFGAVLVAVRWAMTKSFDKVLAAGVVVLTLVGLATMYVGRTDAWLSIAKAISGA